MRFLENQPSPAAARARFAVLLLTLFTAGSALAEETRTGSNRTIGFSIEYPSWVTPQVDEAALAQAVTDGRGMLAGDFDGTETGQQSPFFLDVPGSKPVVANSGLDATGGIKRPRSLSAEELRHASLERFPTVMPGAVLRAPIGEVRLGGKTWYRADFEFVTSGLQLTARTMVRQSRKTMDTLTFVDESAALDDQVGRIDGVPASIELKR